MPEDAEGMPQDIGTMLPADEAAEKRRRRKRTTYEELEHDYVTIVTTLLQHPKVYGLHVTESAEQALPLSYIQSHTYTSPKNL